MPRSHGAAQVGRSGHKDKAFKSNHKDHKYQGKDTKSTCFGKQSSASSSSAPPEPSFLFVVNELKVDYEPLPGQYQPAIDHWGNLVPPSRAEAYGQETEGVVFRYSRGSVEPAEGYRWLRIPAQVPMQPGQYQEIIEGRIVKVLDDEDESYACPAVYNTLSIFACSAQLPIVLADTDASLGTAFLRNNCHCDSQYDHGSLCPWYVLHFQHCPTRAVSFANPRGQGQPYVAGVEPTWIPSLVPRIFANRGRGNHPRSTGLAGDLPVVIGLMAFHGERKRASEVFGAGLWRDSRWYGPNRTPAGYPCTGEEPRGLLVQVCLDNLDNPMGSTDEALYRLEYEGILVHG